MQLDNVQNERDKLKKGTHAATESTRKLNGRFTSSLHCAKTLVSSHGLSVVYTGHVINTIREAAFVGMYFYCYEGFKVQFKCLIGSAEMFWRTSFQSDTNNQDSLASSLAIPIAGGCAGATSWAFTFPLDCVRAGVQGQHITETYVHKQGAVETLKQLCLSKGITGLYAGVGPSIARAFLVSGSRFSAYEGAVTLCRWSGLSPGDGRYREESSGSYDD